MTKTTTIKFTDGSDPIISKDLDLHAAGDMMRVVDKVANKTRMISSSKIASIFEQDESLKSTYTVENRVMALINRDCEMLDNVCILSNSGSFLAMIDEVNGTRTWLPVHALEEIEINTEKKPDCHGDTVRIHFNDGHVRPFVGAWVNPNGAFLYISSKSEGRAHWFPASAIANIEFLS